MKRGRKETDRTAVVYVRVNPDNAAWFKARCKKSSFSCSKALDALLSAYRNTPALFPKLEREVS